MKRSPLVALENLAKISKVDIAEMEKNFTIQLPKFTASTKKPNFNIMSWNVAGLRACLKKIDIDSFIKQLHEYNVQILCLQESKCTPDQIHDFRLRMKDQGYSLHCDISEKAGYCGVFSFCKFSPLNVIKGLDSENTNNSHERGRCLIVEHEQFYVINL
ncbi:MAG: DNA-(apurinic or apyrimidinic site) lyase, partial [Paramarteilia canceri]